MAHRKLRSCTRRLLAKATSQSRCRTFPSKSSSTACPCSNSKKATITVSWRMLIVDAEAHWSQHSQRDRCDNYHFHAVSFCVLSLTLCVICDCCLCVLNVISDSKRCAKCKKFLPARVEGGGGRAREQNGNPFRVSYVSSSGWVWMCCTASLRVARKVSTKWWAYYNGGHRGLRFDGRCAQKMD